MEVLSNEKYSKKNKHIVTMDGIWNYIDTCTLVLSTIFVADALFRAFRALREYFVYTNYYLPDKRLSKILKRAYKYNVSTIVTMVVLILVALLRLRATGKLFIVPPLYFLAFIPIYWLCQGINLSYSAIDYAMWIRGDHGLDSATGMANSYFHGYLKLTMPASDDDNGIRRRIDLYEQQHRVKFAIHKLVILVPTTMYISGKIESRIMSYVASLERQVKNRAGIKRPYENPVYRFNDRINGTYYYVTVEGATPILTFFETINHQLTNTWQIKEMRREILLKFCKHLRKLIYGWEETRHEIELILYDDYNADGEREDVGEILLAYIKNHWAKKKNSNDTHLN